MYKGLARLVGMDIIGKAQTLDEQMQVLEENWKKYDFFFIHFKYNRQHGRRRQLRRQGEADRRARRLRPADHGARPTVLIVTGRPQHAELPQEP